MSLRPPFAPKARSRSLVAKSGFPLAFAGLGQKIKKLGHDPLGGFDATVHDGDAIARDGGAHRAVSGLVCGGE